MKCFSTKQIKLRNLPKLRSLSLDIFQAINFELHSFIFDHFPNIEELSLKGKLFNFNLDNLHCLNSIKFDGTFMYDFNWDILKNICNQLEKIVISCSNFDNQYFDKLFYGHKFPNLLYFEISESKMHKIEKRLFDGFPTIKQLKIYGNKHIQIINHDAFSNLNNLNGLFLANNCILPIDNRLFSNLVNLKYLNLSENRLETIEENPFSNLHNLEFLDLNSNKLKSLSPKLFVGLNNLKEIRLNSNKLANFDFEILDNIRQIKTIYLNNNPIMIEKEILNRFLEFHIRIF